MAATPEQSARRILMSLVYDVKLTAGDEIPDRVLRARFEARGGHVDEIAAGLEFAHAMEWIEHDRGPAKGRFRLTAAGVLAAG
jgi:hypothetical protein